MKAVTVTLSLIAMLASSSMVEAQASSVEAGMEANFPFPYPNRPGPGPGRPGFPGRPGPGGPGFPGRPGEVIYQPLHRSYQGQSTIALRQVLNIGPQYRGRRIQHVILRASTAAGQGQAVVTVNGQAVTASQTVARYSQEYRFILPQWADEIGNDVQQLQMELRGNFFVEGVGVVLQDEWGRPGPGPGLPMREVIHLNQSFRGGHRIALGTLVNLDRYRGMRLRAVVLRASTAAGQGDATFCGSMGCSTVQNVARIVSDYSFPIRGDVVDHTARNWSIDLRGNFHVESIRLEFMR